MKGAKCQNSYFHPTASSLAKGSDPHTSLQRAVCGSEPLASEDDPTVVYR